MNQFGAISLTRVNRWCTLIGMKSIFGANSFSLKTVAKNCSESDHPNKGDITVPRIDSQR